MQKFSTVDLRRDLVRGYEKSRDPVYGPNEARKSWWTSFCLSSIAWSKKAEKPMAYARPTVPSLVILSSGGGSATRAKPLATLLFVLNVRW